MELFLSLAVSLALTLALELAFALVWRVERSDLPAVALANLLTNPVVVLCRHGAAWYFPRYLSRRPWSCGRWGRRGSFTAAEAKSTGPGLSPCAPMRSPSSPD